MKALRIIVAIALIGSMLAIGISVAIGAAQYAHSPQYKQQMRNIDRATRNADRAVNDYLNYQDKLCREHPHDPDYGC
jgi:type II secretory pathway pseudopilin PulG